MLNYQRVFILGLGCMGNHGKPSDPKRNLPRQLHAVNAESSHANKMVPGEVCRDGPRQDSRYVRGIPVSTNAGYAKIDHGNIYNGIMMAS